MPTTIRLPLRVLDAKVIKDLWEEYLDTEVYK